MDRSRRLTGMRERNEDEGDVVTQPDHAENTGDNLRHAAEVQEQARTDRQTEVSDGQSAPVDGLPDFNT